MSPMRKMAMTRRMGAAAGSLTHKINLLYLWHVPNLRGQHEEVRLCKELETRPSEAVQCVYCLLSTRAELF